jgi:hypothetical protein
MSRDEIKGQEHLHARRLALAKAFSTFASRWSQRFAAKQVPTLLPVWLVAVEYLPVEQIEPLAVQFTAKFEGKYPPSPQEFASWARQTLGRHDGGARTNHAPIVCTSIWEWVSPVTGRFSRAERDDQGNWRWFAIDDAEPFLRYDDDARRQYCEAMSLAHPVPERLMWRPVRVVA